MTRLFTLRPARPEDRDAILECLRPWNMHHVPSPEMERIELDRFFVAELSGQIVGAAGYTFIAPGRGKTTLLGVLPRHNALGIGAALQEARVQAMAAQGATKITTNADRPQVIAWYKKHWGYREVGKLPKLHSFGDDAVAEWTTLEMDVGAWQAGRRAG
jgi:ribosomal-protein-alanine N-acetyltransferase